MGKDGEFLEAARHGNLQVLEKYLIAKTRRSGPFTSLRRGPGVNVQDSSGYSSLHHASLNGHKEAVSLLLRYEASLNMQDSKGSTALHMASWAGHLEVVQILIRQGPCTPRINHQNHGGDAALHCAAQYGHLEIAQLLIIEGADASLPNLKAETALDLAAQFGRLALVGLLIDEAKSDLLKPYTADAATAAVFPHTPLHLASRNGHLGIVELLIAQGHHVNVRTSRGGPLHEAAICGKVDVVRTLINAGADPGVRNDLGHTVLDTIASVNTKVTKDIALIISLHGPLIDICDNVSVAPSEMSSKASSMCQSSDDSIAIPVLAPTPPQRSDSLNISFSRPAPDMTLGTSQSRAPCPLQMSRLLGYFDDDSVSLDAVSCDFHNRCSSSLSKTECAVHNISYFSPSECGGLYENVLVPTRIYQQSHSDGESSEMTLNKKQLRTSVSCRSTDLKPTRRQRRYSDRETRSTDKESLNDWSSKIKRIADKADDSRLSDRESSCMFSDRDCRLSDIDDRTSLTSRASESHSEYSSVYDIPPAPRRKFVCNATDKGFLRANTTQEYFLEDDTTYEILPPSRSSQSIKFSKWHFDSSTEQIPNRIPPAKPPRRSICPSSFVDDNVADGTYEMICFSRSGKQYKKSDNELLDEKRPARHSMPTRTASQDQSNKICRHSSDSDSDSSCKRKELTTTKIYGTMSFKPVKSRRTTMIPYENTTHTYENSLSQATKPFRHKGSSKSSDSLLMNDIEYEQDPWTPTFKKDVKNHLHHVRTESNKSMLLDFDSCYDPTDELLSRDAETETEIKDITRQDYENTALTPDEDANVLSASSCSLSSVSETSRSDQSTDNIEQVKCDTPFAGLYRGSKVPEDWVALGASMTRDRPTSLVNSANTFRLLDKGYRSSLPNNSTSLNNNYDADKKLGPGQVLSPLDEVEEWARISDIMASFGAGVARESVFMDELEKEFQQRLGLSLSPSQPSKSLLPLATSDNANIPMTENFDSIASWLKMLNLPQYYAIFMSNGFDDLNFLSGIIDYQDLHDIGILDLNHSDLILSSVAKMSSSIIRWPADNLTKWLKDICLPQYEETFAKHGFGDMERIRKIWEVELSVVLEVTLLGHRKRMLASLGDRPIEPQLPCSLAPQELNHELSKLNTDISELKEKFFMELPDSTSRVRSPAELNIHTFRKPNVKRRVAPLPPSLCATEKFNINKEISSTDEISLREPSQLAVGVSNSFFTTWKHSPTKLVESAVQYVAEYLGSTHVKELKGTESTMKSISKLRRSVGVVYRLPRITISVSYSGVKFIDTDTKELICEHEIRNIHCTCQESDDLTHFAYITKDVETEGHYCHVFRVPAADLANEIVMTIGQAFEVAFQLAIRNRYSSEGQIDLKNQGRSRCEQDPAQLIRATDNRLLSSSSRHCSDNIVPPNNSLENLLDSGQFSDKETSPQPTNESLSHDSTSSSNGTDKVQSS